MRQSACIGAFAILQRFNEVEDRQSQLRGQLLRKGYRAKYGFEDVIGESEAIRRTKDVLRRMAASESPVLLIGQTGTGKELFAHAVHRASRRKDGPFVAINVAAFPENLLESELFGYEEGRLHRRQEGRPPGPDGDRPPGHAVPGRGGGHEPGPAGEAAAGLQEREIMRVGGTSIIPIDVRIVAATNEDLERRVEAGTFRGTCTTGSTPCRW